MHFFSFSPNPHLHRDLPDLVGRMPLVAFLLAGKWCREKGRFSPFAQCVRNFLELNCPFLKVPVLTLGSQYPWIASLVVRSKWRVNTPGSSSFSCSDQYSDSGRRDVTWSLLLPSLWSLLFYPSPLQPIWTPLVIPAGFGEPSSSTWSLPGMQQRFEQFASEGVWLLNTHLLHRPFLDMKANYLPLCCCHGWAETLFSFSLSSLLCLLLASKLF